MRHLGIRFCISLDGSIRKLCIFSMTHALALRAMESETVLQTRFSVLHGILTSGTVRIKLRHARTISRQTGRENYPMKATGVAGALLATAVALAFTASATSAGDTPSPSAQAARIKCLGANACKGQSACKTAANDCQGKNSCAGKGYIITADAKSCEAKGGRVGKKPPMPM